MIHPDTEVRFVRRDLGYGVFATRRIPRGTIVWTRCLLDRKITPTQIAAVPPAYRKVLETYAYIDRTGHSILCWDNARFMNHSCAANTRSFLDVDIAVRDIEAGEQVTCEYGGLNLPWSFTCGCGSSDCRGAIRSDDVLLHWSTWDEEIREAAPCLRRVEQPLADFIVDQESLDAVLDGHAPFPSLLDDYWRGREATARRAHSTHSV